MNVYVGTSGYGYKEWKGKFYPDKISSKEMLRFYSKHFNTVEVNNTFYRMPTENVLLSWAEQVPADFIFTFKAPQIITHLKRLKNVVQETEYLFKTLSVLGTRLGAVLFQFPKSFRADPRTLDAFLALIPSTPSCAFEFRSTSRSDPEILNILRSKGCSLCLTDSDEVPSTQIISTASWGYARLRKSGYADSDLTQWAREISAQQWREAFVFFKHEEEASGPRLAMRFRELAGRL